MNAQIIIHPTSSAATERGAAAEREPQLTAKRPDHEWWIAFVRDPDGNLSGCWKNGAACSPQFGDGQLRATAHCNRRR